MRMGRMLRFAGLALTVVIGLYFTGCASAPPGSAPAPAKAEKGYKYVCGCGDNCACGTNGDKPGTCVCGKPLVYKKVLKEDNLNYWICPCDSDALDPKDPTMCACGKKLMSFPKKGRYGCACAGCDCNTQSIGPGKCPCGVEMKAQ